MTALALDISLARGGFRLSLSRDLPLSGLTAIFGPSGAGKSTLLRAIAGFDRAEGRIAFAHETWQDGRRFVAPHRRRVATVFQTPRLFPHLDVRGNLAYAARRSGRMAELAETADRFGARGLLDRAPATLSGGEAQRVALARAVLTAPRLILMDEPLSALDRAARAEILPLIEELRDDAAIPILYVSHSLAEVARLATATLALAGGECLGFGPTATILADPAAGPAFGGKDPGSLIAATAGEATADGLQAAVFSGGTILLPGRIGPPGAPVQLFIRAREVMIATDRPAGLSALNILPARVTALRDLDAASAEVTLDCGGTTLRAHVTRRSVAALGLSPGLACHAILKSVALARE